MDNLESMVKRVLAAGYSTGHADDFEMLCGECVMNLEQASEEITKLKQICKMDSQVQKNHKAEFERLERDVELWRAKAMPMDEIEANSLADDIEQLKKQFPKGVR